MDLKINPLKENPETILQFPEKIAIEKKSTSLYVLTSFDHLLELWLKREYGIG